jgi:hypothetical protein
LLLTVLVIAAFSFSKNNTNFVFFQVDDMGMKDLGTYGSTFHEPPTLTTYLPQRKNK